MIPVRCFTCGKVVANKWEQYQKYIGEGLSEGLDEGLSEGLGEGLGEYKTLQPNQALDMIGMKRYCCRRMFLTHVPIIDKLLLYPQHVKIPQMLVKNTK